MFFRQQEELRRLKDELAQKDIKIRQLELELNNLRNSPNINNNNNSSSNGSSIWRGICAVSVDLLKWHSSYKPPALLKHMGFLFPNTQISFLQDHWRPSACLHKAVFHSDPQCWPHSCSVLSWLYWTDDSLRLPCEKSPIFSHTASLPAVDWFSLYGLILVQDIHCIIIS